MIEVIVFDFDGTLVQSNQLKYEAFFTLFPNDEHHHALVRDVLGEFPEASRYVALAEILERLGVSGEEQDLQVNRLAKQYNEIVLEGAKTCPECLDAEAILRKLSQSYALYVSSTTPKEALREILRVRKWDGYFQDIFGYPCKKVDTLRDLLRKEQISSVQLLVVGDGISDRDSAGEIGCAFFNVNVEPLSALERWIHVLDAGSI